MALEASEIAVRVRLLGGSAFQTESQKVAASTEEIGAAGKKANADLATSFTSVSSKLDSVGSKMIAFGRTMSMAAIPLVAAGVYASKTASTFQQQMTLLSTNANESAKNIGWMSTAVLNLGKQFGQTPVDMAKGLYNFESIGIHGKKALDDIKAAAMGSAVGLDSLANTTDVLSSIMKTKITGAGGPVEAMSLLDRAVGMGKMHLQDLSQALTTGVVPMAKSFGMDLNSVLALVAGLTGLGTPAGQVAARARLMFTSMEALTPGGAKALAPLGIGKYTLANDLNKPGHLITALQDLSSHLSTLGSAPEQNAVLAAVFGRSRGMGQITGSLQDLNNLIQTYGTLQNTTPATLQQHFAQTEQTTAFKEKRIRAQFDADMVTLGNTINLRVLPVLMRLIQPLQSVVNWFGKAPHAIQDFILGLSVFVIGSGPLFLFGGALVKGAGMFLAGIERIIGPLGAAKLEASLGSTAGAFSTLLPLMAAAAVYFGLFHTKVGRSLRHDVENSGKGFGISAGDAVLSTLHSLGLVHGNITAANVYAFEHSGAFTGLPGIARGDIEQLIEGHSYASSHLGQVAQDLKGWMTPQEVGKIPGLSEKVKQAIEDGMKKANITITMPNGRVIAQVVNDENRRNQNRR